MTMRPSLMLWLTVLAWVALGLVVLNHNFVPFGRLTLRWSPPLHSTTHFRWHRQPPRSVTDLQSVILSTGQPLRFTVNLPRGFRTGLLTVSARRPASRIRLSTITAAGSAITTESDNGVARLTVRWGEIFARSRNFDFQLEALTPAASIPLQSIIVIAQR